MMPKATPQDLTNPDTVDDLIRCNRKLRAEASAAAVREAELQRVGEEAVEKMRNQFGIAYDVVDISRWQAALRNPSPLAGAVGAVLGLMDKWRETAFKSDWEAIDEDLAAAWDAYRALRDGTPETDADGGE